MPSAAPLAAFAAFVAPTKSLAAVTSFAISTLLSNGKIRLAGDLIDYIFNQASNPTRWNIGSSFSLIMLVLILLSIGFLRKVDPDNEGGGMW